MLSDFMCIFFYEKSYFVRIINYKHLNRSSCFIMNLSGIIIVRECKINVCMKSLKTSHRSYQVNGQKKLNIDKKKPKIVVLRRSFNRKYRNDEKILQSKDASSVIKRLNWENKNLFGPIQNSKADLHKGYNILESNKIIQHETIIPLVDPVANSESMCLKKSVLKSTERSDLKNTSFLNLLLHFPLMNKSISSKNNSILKINELNVLRKQLEKFSCTHIPSVTQILEKSMSKENAENLLWWKQNMIKQVGKEGFQRYQAELFAKGSAIHECINNFLTATPEAELPITAGIKGHWESLKYVLPHVCDVKLMEERISHPFLHYKGVVDCFAKYKNHLVVIDWKTSKKPKNSLASIFDNPLQIAAYVGALNFDPKFQYLANKGLIVVAYENGTPASTHFIDEFKMLLYWKEWLNRLKTYWEITLSE